MIVVPSLRSNALRVVVICILALGLGVQTGAQVPSPREPAASAASATAGISVDGHASRAASASSGQMAQRLVLTDRQMTATVGAGFWSSLWEGMKIAGEVVLFLGVLWLVEEVCNNPQVSCNAF
jgi:hypothetical protein